MTQFRREIAIFRIPEIGRSTILERKNKLPTRERNAYPQIRVSTFGGPEQDMSLCLFALIEGEIHSILPNVISRDYMLHTTNYRLNGAICTPFLIVFSLRFNMHSIYYLKSSL